jgi:hypothetical protein
MKTRAKSWIFHRSFRMDHPTSYEYTWTAWKIEKPGRDYKISRTIKGVRYWRLNVYDPDTKKWFVTAPYCLPEEQVFRIAWELYQQHLEHYGSSAMYRRSLLSLPLSDFLRMGENL